MSALAKIGPLNWQVRIVDEQGRPTPDFTRYFQQLVGNGTLVDGRATQALTAATDTDSEAERIRDVIGTALIAGSNVTITVNEGADTITIASTGGALGASGFDGGSAAIGGRGFVLDGGTSAARSDLDYWIDGGTA